MSYSHHTTNNCYSCNKSISDGIIRNCNLYCSETCYYNKTHYHPVMPVTPVRNITCNYCLEIFDRNSISGVPHGAFWFCCQNHLILANPRPKSVIIGPFMGPVMGPVMGPFMGMPIPAFQHVIGPGVPLYGMHSGGPFIRFP